MMLELGCLGSSGEKILLYSVDCIGKWELGMGGHVRTDPGWAKLGTLSYWLFINSMQATPSKINRKAIAYFLKKKREKGKKEGHKLLIGVMPENRLDSGTITGALLTFLDVWRIEFPFPTIHYGGSR